MWQPGTKKALELTKEQKNVLLKAIDSGVAITPQFMSYLSQIDTAQPRPFGGAEAEHVPPHRPSKEKGTQTNPSIFETHKKITLVPINGNLLI